MKRIILKEVGQGISNFVIMVDKFPIIPCETKKTP
jgi:hypothetical protein